MYNMNNLEKLTFRNFYRGRLKSQRLLGVVYPHHIAYLTTLLLTLASRQGHTKRFSCFLFDINV